MPNLAGDQRTPLQDPNKSHGEFMGIYRAIVEDNIDPHKIGRVRVRVPMIHGSASTGLSKKALPWATLCSMSAGYEYGTFLVPEVGEYGFVMFEDGDSNKPVYLGSSFGRGPTKSKTYGSDDGLGTWKSTAYENEVPNDVEGEIPCGKMIYKSPKGSAIYFQDDNGYEEISIVDPLGQVIRMESDLTTGTKHTRHFGDVDISEEDANLEESTGARIVIMDGLRQRLEMKSSTSGSELFLGTKAKDGFSIKADVSGNGDKMILNLQGNTIEIDKSGNITINGSGKAILHGGTVSIQGGSNVTVQGSGVDIIGSLIRLIGLVKIIES